MKQMNRGNPINLLPQVPYVVKRRNFLILIAVIVAVTVLSAQLSLAYLWKASRHSDEMALQQASARVQELQRKTTLSPETRLYQQGADLLKQLTELRPDWSPVLNSIFAVMSYQGQIDQLAVSDTRVLTLTTIVLTEDQLHAMLQQLEAVPYFSKLSLNVTEHRRFSSNDKARLLFRDGKTLDLTNLDYYILSVEIALPSILEIRKGD
jgi:hypothetical protein